MSIALNRLGALDAARKLQRRELTAVQLVRACFARIEQRENTIHAWTALQKQAALEHAEQLDKGPLRGPLHGLPIGVKDLFDTVDLPTRYGSPIYERHHPGLDAAAVALCRAPARSWSARPSPPNSPPTRPAPRAIRATRPIRPAVRPAARPRRWPTTWCLSRWARRPPAPSSVRPRIAASSASSPLSARFRAPASSLAESLDTVGGFARSVPDIALFASVLMRDPRMLDLNYDAKPRIGMYRSLQWRHAQAETKEAYAQAAAILARAGAQVEEVPQPPAGDCMLVQLHADIMAYEASQSLAYERLEHAAQLSAKIQSVLEAGARITAEEHQRNLARAARCARGVDLWFDRYDVLFTPSASGEAPFADLGTGDPQFSRGWTLFGLPCLNLPFATGPQGLPVGLQVVGPRHADHRTLAISAWMHERLLATQAPDIGAADIWPRG